MVTVKVLVYQSRQIFNIMKTVFIFLAISLTTSLFSQDIHFIKSYGNSGYDYGRDIKQDIDTGYIATGSSSSFGSENADAFLLKVDSLGNFKWSHNYGGSGSEWGESVVLTQDGAYAIAGYSNSGGAGGFDFYFVRTDQTGVPHWEKYYGGSDWDRAYDLAQLPDESFVIVGETYSYGAGNNDIYIVKTDQNGDTLWTRTYGGAEADYANAVLVDGDSIVVVGGTESFGNGMSDGIILKYHVDGTFGGAKTYGQENNDYFTSIEKHNNDYYLGGTRHYYYNQTGYLGDFWVFQISNDGTTVFGDTSMTGGSHEVEIAYDVNVLPNNKIIYAGSTKSFGYSTTDFKTDAFVGKLNADYSQPPFINNFGFVGDDDIRATDNTFDGGFVAIGNSEFNSIGGNNILILKDDASNSIDNIDVLSEIDLDLITLNTEILNKESDFKIYPNPVLSDLNIVGIDDVDFEISIFNLSGSLILTSSANQSISLSELVSGYYIVEISNEHNIYRKKIIKQ